MSQDSFDDASIPVLTEVVRETAPAPAVADAAVAEVVLPDAVVSALTISDPDSDRRSRESANPISHTEAAPVEPPVPAPDLEQRAAAQLSPEDWAALEQRLSERILQQLQGRVDFVLQQRLRDSMADVLQHALAGLTDEIRGGLAQTIEQIVTRAVAQELAHLKTAKH